MATTDPLANINQYVGGISVDPTQRTPGQVAYLNAAAAALVSAGVNPLTANQAQVDAALAIAAQAQEAAAFAAAGLASPVNTPAAPILPTAVTSVAPPAALATTTPISLPGSAVKMAVVSTPKDQYSDSGGVDIGSYCGQYPEDPYCSLYGDFGGLAGSIGGATTVTNTTVIQESGLLASDIHQIVNDALSGLWGVVVGAVDVIFGNAIAGIQTAITELGNAVKAAWDILSRLGGLILRFLGMMWSKVLYGLLRALHDLVAILNDLYQNVLKPLVGVLQKVRQIILDLWKRFIVPVLIILQDIRRFLTILSIFHVKFAAKLDAQLGQLEAKITGPLIYLLGYVNAVGNWVNLIVAANYLIQKPLFLNSLKAYSGESINLQINAMNPVPSAAALATAQQAAGVPTAAQAVTDFDAFLVADSGQLPAVLTQYSAAFDAYLAQGV